MYLRVALTGGIATGKSHCLSQFAALGAAVVDADELAHQVVEPDSPGFKKVIARFGREYVRDDGTLDRRRLGSLIFADEGARRDLEAIVHPAVYAAIEAWFARHRRSIAIADIPLLYETGRQPDFDGVIVAACPRAMQLERLTRRNRLSVEDAQRRIDSQLSIDEKKERADFVIDTSGTFEATKAQIEDVWERLRRHTLPL